MADRMGAMSNGSDVPPVGLRVRRSRSEDVNDEMQVADTLETRELKYLAEMAAVAHEEQIEKVAGLKAQLAMAQKVLQERKLSMKTRQMELRAHRENLWKNELSRRRRAERTRHFERAHQQPVNQGGSAPMPNVHAVHLMEEVVQIIGEALAPVPAGPAPRLGDEEARAPDAAEAPRIIMEEHILIPADVELDGDVPAPIEHDDGEEADGGVHGF